MDVGELKATRYEVDQRVPLITLARPQRLNAWTGRMHTEYRRALAVADTDPEVRAVVVTGEGRGFCAGADATALDRHVEAGRYDDGVREPLAAPGYGVRPEFDHAFAYHFGLRVPVVAAVNGPAAGVGLVLACFCDLRFAAEGAKLTTSSGRLGLPAEYGLPWILPRQVAPGHPADLLLWSRVVLAEEAATMGLWSTGCCRLTSCCPSPSSTPVGWPARSRRRRCGRPSASSTPTSTTTSAPRWPAPRPSSSR